MALTDSPNKLESVWIQRNALNQYYEQINVSGSDLIVYHSSSGELQADKISVWAEKYAIGGSTVKVSNTDTTAGFLSGSKLIPGNNISFSIVSPGGNEALKINASVPDVSMLLSSSWTGSTNSYFSGTSSFAISSSYCLSGSHFDFIYYNVTESALFVTNSISSSWASSSLNCITASYAFVAENLNRISSSNNTTLIVGNNLEPVIGIPIDLGTSGQPFNSLTAEYVYVETTEYVDEIGANNSSFITVLDPLHGTLVGTASYAISASVASIANFLTQISSSTNTTLVLGNSLEPVNNNSIEIGTLSWPIDSIVSNTLLAQTVLYVDTVSSNVSPYVTFTSPILGDLLGTASYALYALSSSYAASSSVSLIANSSSVAISASYARSASISKTSSISETASHLQRGPNYVDLHNGSGNNISIYSDGNYTLVTNGPSTQQHNNTSTITSDGLYTIQGNNGIRITGSGGDVEIYAGRVLINKLFASGSLIGTSSYSTVSNVSNTSFYASQSQWAVSASFTSKSLVSNTSFYASQSQWAVSASWASSSISSISSTYSVTSSYTLPRSNSFESINSLATTNFPIANGEQVFVKGYYTSGDWGPERTARYTSSTAELPNLGNVFTASFGGRFIFDDRNDQVQNLKWFGAKGDGITDDSVAIAAAFSYGNNIEVPVGRYNHTQPIVITTVNPISIKSKAGSYQSGYLGYYTTIKEAEFVYKGVPTTSSFDLTCGTGIRYGNDLENISFDASGSALYALTIGKIGRANLKKVRANNATDTNLYVSSSQFCVFDQFSTSINDDGVIPRIPTKYGIKLEGFCTCNTFIEPIIENSTIYGLWLGKNAINNTFINGTVESNTGGGIYITASAAHNTFDNIWFENNNSTASWIKIEPNCLFNTFTNIRFNDAAASLNLSGSYNTFESCQFGNVNVSGSRNVFRNVIYTSTATDTTTFGNNYTNFINSAATVRRDEIASSLRAQGSITASNGFLGRLWDTASYALTASHALYSLTASYFGTGTNNYLPKWNNNTLTATSLVYDNGNEINIQGGWIVKDGNTALVDYPELFGAWYAAPGIWARGMGWVSGSNVQAMIGGYGNSITGQFQYIYFGSGSDIWNNPWMVISGSGQVGIQTKTPQTTLHVFGPISASAFGTGSLQGTASNAISSSYAITASYAPFSGTASYSINSTTSSYWDSSSVILLVNTKQNIISTGSYFSITSSWADKSISSSFASTASYIGDGTNNYVPVWQNNRLSPTSSITATSTLVGINKTNPQYTIDASGSSFAFGATHTGSSFRLVGEYQSAGDTFLDNDIELIFNSNTRDRIKLVADQISQGSDDYDLRFDFIKDDLSGHNTWMYIDGNTGKVGIGNNAPQSKLHVFGAISASAFGTGSLQGTASNAISSSYTVSSSYAVTASYAPFAGTSSYWDSSSIISILNNKQWTITTGSFLPITTSWSNTSSISLISYTGLYSSHSQWSVSASYSSASISSSYAITASYSLNSGTSSYWDSSSLVTLIDTKQNKIETGSFFPITASWAVSASWVYTAFSALSASWASSSLCSEKVQITLAENDSEYNMIFVSGGLGCNTIYRDTASHFTYNPGRNLLYLDGNILTTGGITGSLYTNNIRMDTTIQLTKTGTNLFVPVIVNGNQYYFELFQ